MHRRAADRSWRAPVKLICLDELEVSLELLDKPEPHFIPGAVEKAAVVSVSVVATSVIGVPIVSVCHCVPLGDGLS